MLCNKYFFSFLIVFFLNLSLFSQNIDDTGLVLDQDALNILEKAKKVYDDEVVLAYVNENIITFKDIKFWYLNVLLNNVHLYPEITLTEESIDNFLNEALEKGIKKQILQQEIDRLDLYPTEKKILEGLERYKQSFNSEEEYEKYLKISDIDVKEVKNTIGFQQALKNLMIHVHESVTLATEEEKVQWYEKYKDKYYKIPRQIRFLLIDIANPGNNKDLIKRNKEMIQMIRQNILDGKKEFTFYAKNFSDDKSSKNSGDYGFSTIKELDKKFHPLADLEIGKLSPIFDYDKGFYIAKVIEERKEKYQSYEEVKNKVHHILKRVYNLQHRSTYINALKSKAKIEILNVKKNKIF